MSREHQNQIDAILAKTAFWEDDDVDVDATTETEEPSGIKTLHLNDVKENMARLRNDDHLEYSQYVTAEESMIPGGGIGLFAAKPIPKGTEIGKFVGDVIDEKTHQERYPTDESHYSLRVQMDEKDPENNIYVDQANLSGATSFMRFANAVREDSKFNNMEVVTGNDGIPVGIATQDIPAKTEILWSYGADYPWGGIELKDPANNAVYKPGGGRSKTFQHVPEGEAKPVLFRYQNKPKFKNRVFWKNVKRKARKRKKSPKTIKPK